MAPIPGRNRSHEFKDLSGTGPRELDPEEDRDLTSDSEGSVEGSDRDDAFRGREHYESVGKSKLRKAPAISLGPQYRGAKISRDVAAENDEEDDPFSKSFDEDDSESERSDMDEDDEEEEEDSLEELDVSDGDEGADGYDSSQTDLSEEDVETRLIQEDSVKAVLDKSIDREAQRAVTASISQANKEDAEKGRAVKRQNAAFDVLLGTRMKLQKSLVAGNTIVGLPPVRLEQERDDAAQALKAAETAAFDLWSSLSEFRDDLLAAKAGHKRKRAHLSIHSTTQDLFTAMQAQENESKPSRDAILRKWSNKSQGVVVRTERSRLNQNETQATIIDILQEHLSNTERLMKRAYTPRSCAPLQLAQRKGEDSQIYDDADFYSLLLKELLEQKSQDSATASNIDLGFQMRREAKTKKNVDTKASKGRKLRYTVHEKLQNFMAPEDRGTWGIRQADELFGSLFGQKLELGEKDDAADDEELDEKVAPEEVGLVLFRN